MNEDGFLYYRDRVCVPNDNEVKKSILEEAHCGSFAIHPGSTKNVSGFEDFILVVRNEERCFGFCDQMYGMPKGEGRTSNYFGFVANY